MKLLVDECLSEELATLGRNRGCPEASHASWIGNPRIHNLVTFGESLCTSGRYGWSVTEMAREEPRLTITVDPKIYEGLMNVTNRRRPRLTKRYVVELALTRLLDEVNNGQLELGLEVKSDRRR